MIGYLIELQLKKVTLSRGIKFLFLLNILFLVGCGEKRNEKYTENDNFKAASASIIDKLSYDRVFSSAFDSLKHFQLNLLSSYNFLNGGQWYLDSLICFNNEGNKCITSILYTNSNTKTAKHDGIVFFYGFKKDTLWYFFVGESVHVPREMIPNQNKQIPLNYKQLHKIALTEIYSPYLTKNGIINEEWFKHKFEGPGWGTFEDQSIADWCFNGKRYSNKKEFYDASHLCKIKRNWLQRDTTQPIKQLPAKLP